MKQRRLQLGVHISDQDLSLVVLTSTEGRIAIPAWQRMPLEPGTVDGGRIREEAVVGKRIAQFLKENKFGPMDVVLSLTLNVARLKVASIKATSDEDLHAQVTSDMERYTPFGRENTYATYGLQKTAEEAGAPTSVLEVLTSHCAGDSCLNVCLRARLSNPLLEAALLPLIRVLLGQGTLPTAGVVLLLVMDADAGMVCILQNGILAFCRNVDLGVNACVADKENTTLLRQAAQPVIAYAKSLSDEPLNLYVVADGSYDELRVLTPRVRRCCRNVKVHQLSPVQIVKHLEVDHSGETKEIPILALAQVMSTQVVDGRIEVMNLIPPSSLQKVSARRDMSRIGKAIAAVVLLAVALVIPVNIKTGRVEADSVEVASQIAAVRPLQEKIKALQDETQKLQKKIASYRQGTAGLVVLPWNRLLADVVASVPGGLRVTGFVTWPEGLFAVAGEALSEDVVHGFVTALSVQTTVAEAHVEEVQYHHKSQSFVEYSVKGRIAVPESQP